MTGKERIDYGDFYFRPVLPGDVETIAANLREADRREIKRWSGNTELYEVQNAVNLSEVLWVGCLKDGTAASIFGATRANVLDETGVIWELSTTEVDKHKFLFGKASRKGFELVCKALPDVSYFYNYIDLEYTQAVNWLSWLGGYLTLDDALRGRCGGVFKQFLIINPEYDPEGRST